MDQSLQKLFGVEKFDEPRLPGTRAKDPGKVIYIYRQTDTNTSESFDKVVDVIDPPLFKEGAALLEWWLVTTPTGSTFYSVYFHGDLNGWRQQIEIGAKRLGLATARVEDDKFVVSDGSAFLLSDCLARME